MLDGKKILAIILARKNSVGLPGKNYRKLCGKPLFIWSVIAAINSKYVDAVVVSSCCTVVKKDFFNYVNNLYGNNKVIEFIDRDEKLNGPQVKNEPVMIDAYDKMVKINSFYADIIVSLQPTSPVRTNNLIDQCLEKYKLDKADSLVTVSKNYPFIFHQHDERATCPNMYFTDRPMRQEIRDWQFALIDNGNVYITKKDILLNHNNRLGGRITTYVTDKYQSLQIDDLEDFNLIEKMAEIYQEII